MYYFFCIKQRYFLNNKQQVAGLVAIVPKIFPNLKPNASQDCFIPYTDLQIEFKRFDVFPWPLVNKK